tara:strand:- start:287 stop:814 length:528 start_codon:yes stop_codon:yes gene_type:complete
MNIPSLERYLNSFGKQIVKQAKENLSAADKKGALANSIDFFVIKKGGSITVRFKMNSYGAFVDKGVSGTKTKRSYKDYKGKTKSSPFKYKAKQPPSGIIEKWIKRKGLKGRDKKGRFITHKSLSFLIARSIKKKGIQGISFFQKPLMLGMKQFSSKFGKAIADDIVNSLRQQKIA